MPPTSVLSYYDSMTHSCLTNHSVYIPPLTSLHQSDMRYPSTVVKPGWLLTLYVMCTCIDQYSTVLTRVETERGRGRERGMESSTLNRQL